MVMDAIQAAKDQSLFRGVNERLLDMNKGFDEVSGDADFLCECASQDCIKHVSLTLDDYEEIRRVPTHFAVTDSMDHVFADVERIFAKRDGYFVVEKFGEAGVAAIELDPRRRTRLVRPVDGSCARAATRSTAARDHSAVIGRPSPARCREAPSLFATY
jgi:hypothetical protein